MSKYRASESTGNSGAWGRTFDELQQRGHREVGVGKRDPGRELLDVEQVIRGRVNARARRLFRGRRKLPEGIDVDVQPRSRLL